MTPRMERVQLNGADIEHDVRGSGSTGGIHCSYLSCMAGGFFAPAFLRRQGSQETGWPTPNSNKQSLSASN